MATYIVSQICFDPAVIDSWIAPVRERGTDLRTERWRRESPAGMGAA